MGDEREREYDPYAPPAADVDDVPRAGVDARAEKIRREHIQHETSVKSVGCLFYLGGAVLLGTGLVFAVNGPPGSERAAALLGGLVLAGMGAGYLAVGAGIRSLQTWARIVGALLLVLGLLNFPIGTLISAYCLWLLLGSKGGVVFSPAYKDVIRATPHVAYKQPIAALIVFLVLIAILIGVVVMAAMR